MVNRISVIVQRLLMKEVTAKTGMRSVKNIRCRLFLIKLQQEDGKIQFHSYHSGSVETRFQMAVDDDILVKNLFWISAAGVL